MGNENSSEAKKNNLMDGKKIAADIRQEVKERVQELEETKGVKAGLAVIIVGNRPDSATYVRMKQKACESCGIQSETITKDENVTQEELEKIIDDMNGRKDIHGILVQLPLPKHIDEYQILKRINVEKDVDGFSALNIGNLALKGGDPPLSIPCTPAGCIEMLQRSGVEFEGKNCVIIGRSNIVGMPLIHLMISLNATVTVLHSRSKNIEQYTRKADILIAAVGKAEMVRGDMVKEGCVVVDVGINSVPDATKKRGYRLVGDVCFAEVAPKASLISPVPGGVGPLTVAMLMKNCVSLARVQSGLPRLNLRKDPPPSVPYRIVKD